MIDHDLLTRVINKDLSDLTSWTRKDPDLVSNQGTYSFAEVARIASFAPLPWKIKYGQIFLILLLRCDAWEILECAVTDLERLDATNEELDKKSDDDTRRADTGFMNACTVQLELFLWDEYLRKFCKNEAWAVSFAYFTKTKIIWKLGIFVNTSLLFGKN